jgi:hypothetical protein
MLSRSRPMPEMTITGAIDAVRICTTEVIAMRTCLNHSG